MKKGLYDSVNRMDVDIEDFILSYSSKDDTSVEEAYKEAKRIITGRIGFPKSC